MHTQFVGFVTRRLNCVLKYSSITHFFVSKLRIIKVQLNTNVSLSSDSFHSGVSSELFIFGLFYFKGAPIVNEWVALRPHRDPVRIEKETKHYKNGPLKVRE